MILAHLQKTKKPPLLSSLHCSLISHCCYPSFVRCSRDSRTTLAAGFLTDVVGFVMRTWCFGVGVTAVAVTHGPNRKVRAKPPQKEQYHHERKCVEETVQCVAEGRECTWHTLGYPRDSCRFQPQNQAARFGRGGMTSWARKLAWQNEEKASPKELVGKQRTASRLGRASGTDIRRWERRIVLHKDGVAVGAMVAEIVARQLFVATEEMISSLAARCFPLACCHGFVCCLGVRRFVVGSGGWGKSWDLGSVGHQDVLNPTQNRKSRDHHDEENAYQKGQLHTVMDPPSLTCVAGCDKTL